MINFELNKLQDNQILSRNYTNCNPWKNDFKDNLPILLIPRNAGSETNAFLTNFGKDNCLGIIDSNGNVSHPIKMTMRASQETRFYLYLYTPFLLPITFTYPKFIYFHFEIEPYYNNND